VGTGPPPESVPVPTSDSETLTPATGLPDASETFSSTGGEIAAATTTSLGGTANASVAAAPALTVNDALVTGVSAPPVAVSCFAPAVSSTRSSNSANPLPSVLRLVVPCSVPLPDESATLTPTPDCATSFP